ncbi:MAG: hypothetical protein QNK92_14105 [Amylibacter sp.]
MVRSLPKTAELDNGYADFARHKIEIEQLMQAFQLAMQGKFVDQSSANLVTQVAHLASTDGVQGQKAETATVFGTRNL